MQKPADYTAENQAIKNAREDLNSAIAKRDAAAANAGALKAELDQYNSNKSELENKTAIQSKLTATISAIDTDEYAAAAPEYSGGLASLCKDWRMRKANTPTLMHSFHRQYRQELTRPPQRLTLTQRTLQGRLQRAAMRTQRATEESARGSA